MSRDYEENRFSGLTDLSDFKPPETENWFKTRKRQIDARLEKYHENQQKIRIVLQDLEDISSVNFTGALLIDENLSGRDLHGISFQSAYFLRCNLSNCNLMDCNLVESIFIECDLSNVDFDGANLTKSWINATAPRSSFRKSVLNYAVLTGDFSKVTFADSTMRHAWLRLVELTDTTFENADLANTTRDIAKMSRTTIMPNGKPYHRFKNRSFD